MGFLENQIYLVLIYKTINSFRFLDLFFKNDNKYAVILYFKKMFARICWDMKYAFYF